MGFRLFPKAPEEDKSLYFLNGLLGIAVLCFVGIFVALIVVAIVAVGKFAFIIPIGIIVGVWLIYLIGYVVTKLGL